MPVILPGMAFELAIAYCCRTQSSGGVHPDHQPNATTACANACNEDLLAMTTLLTAEPQLFVRDVAVAVEFYTRKLGFSLAFSYGEPPFYVEVFRDGARLNLRCVDSEVVDPLRRDAEQLLAASIALDDAKPLFHEYQAAGVEFVQSLRSEPWGARTFIVRDPDGNLVLFAGQGE
jgi:catechol 2,3-dioxygenase-like lactoylglutathione lyase family enzyme